MSNVVLTIMTGIGPVPVPLTQAEANRTISLLSEYGARDRYQITVEAARTPASK